MNQEKEPKGFKRIEKNAKKLLANPNKLKALLVSAKEKGQRKKEQLASVWNEFQTLLRLIKAYWKKEYREVPWRTILYAATAILYFVTPFDFIPDFIPISGLLDDVSVITFVISSIHGDLEKFKMWEKEEKQIDDK